MAEEVENRASVTPASPSKRERLTVFLVWTFRVIVGATFVISGLSKMIDLWGSVYKIEQYLSVWEMTQPRTLVLGVVICMNAIEFLLGFLLLLGCYKRSAAYLLTLMMAGLLVLSGYIMVANPVEDCGCFGDFIIISNTATFVKNLVLMAMLLYLCRFNSRVRGLFTTYSQWLVAFVAIVYLGVIGMFGYNIQPLLDFRPYHVGTPITGSDTDGDETAEMRFVYTKAGESREFDEDNLPDSTWTFVGRVEPESMETERAIAIFDGDEEVTDELLDSEGEMLLLLIPELSNTDISSTYLINEIDRYVSNRGGRMVGVLGTDSIGVDRWRDISMASYPLYTADDTAIKEIARGNVALVYLKDGIIQWKRTLISIDSDLFSSPDDMTLERLAYPGTTYFKLLTLVFLGLELLLWIVDRSGRAVKVHFTRKNRKK